MNEKLRTEEIINPPMSGPFPHQVDPWAEIPRYFNQLHTSMVQHLLMQIQDMLWSMGYVASLEPSVQFGDNPLEIAVSSAQNAAYQGIRIFFNEPYTLVSVIELVLPERKANLETRTAWQERRKFISETQKVNVVEIDLTRSMHHFTQQNFAAAFARHVVVYLPGRSFRLIGMHYTDSLKRVILPLRQEVITLELQAAYESAYQLNKIETQIQQDNNYTEAALPFPSLLTEPQKKAALTAVSAWQAQLAQHS
ncbi:MAG: DUF4058 family protein [Chitinophagaceae bacterium]|nr:DUF4058 family protein [Anaerolineae bacterium]